VSPLSLSIPREVRIELTRENSGRNYTIPATDVDINEARTTFETNFFAIVAITKSFTPLLIAAKGLILNIGSLAAVIPYVFGSIYNASKAALHAYSQTLRLELEPFDVRVLVVVTGGVKSRIARTERILPDNSLYLEIKGDYERRLKHSQEGAMPTETYARGVVSEALKPAWRQKKWLWRGNKSLVVWFASRVLGGWVFDIMVPRMFGLHRLKRLLRGRV
jgi:1-acylglycerone phosphate reductase